ncbi:hypothetical protein GCM10020369_69790 [Cryptosporangium minutisporangium]|uniref:Lipoprotein n=1 Tax=Cryptosporangium minutisporangium TaxID=113569 RepID=A0ABP6T9A8_9ACTN
MLATGCGVVGDSTVAEAVKQAVETPQQKLLAATATSSTAPYSYTVVQKGDPTDAIEFSGSVNPAGKAYDMKIVNTFDDSDGSLTLVYRIVDQKLWMKAKFTGASDLVEFPDKWMLVDPTRLTTDTIPTSFREYDVDPAQLNWLVTTTNDVTEGAGGKFSGTFDLTQQPEMDVVGPATRKALGEKAKALPFTATVTSGKVTQFVLSVPATSASKAQTYTINYTGFGTVTPVVAPTAAETAPTPDVLYEVLAG